MIHNSISRYINQSQNDTQHNLMIHKSQNDTLSNFMVHKSITK